MSRLGFADAFARFGARLRNVQWSVCAEADDGSLVVSCWEHLFGKLQDGAIRYSDDLARWEGPGNSELRECLANAFRSGQVIRAVIAKAEDPSAIDAGIDASTVKKTFSVKEDWGGKVVEYDGQKVVIEFKRDS